MSASIRCSLSVFGLLSILAACGPAQAMSAATKPAPTAATITPRISLDSETPEPAHTNRPAAGPKCFTAPEGSPIVAFLPDNISILIKEPSGIRVFNLETMEDEGFLKASPGSDPVALSPDRELMARALQDYTIQLIRLMDGKLLHTLHGHTGPVTKLRFSSSGDRLFSASGDTWVRVWDRNGKLLDAFQPAGADNLPNEIQGIGISPDGTMLGSVPFDGPTRVWNLTDKKEIVNLGGTGGDVTSDIAFSPDGQLLAADPLGRLSVWRTSDWEKIWSGVMSMAFAFSPDGRFLAYSDMDDSFNVFVRSLQEPQETRILARQQTFIYELLFSPDGALLASAGAGIQIWQFKTGQLLYVGQTTCP